MNPTLDSTTLVTAMLWLLALALPLAMLLWMAAQFVALRSLGRRVRALEGAARTAAVGAGASAGEALSERPAASRPESGSSGEQDGRPDDRPETTDSAAAAPPDDDRAASDSAEGHA